MQALVRTIMLAALSTFAATAATAEETECRGAIGAQSLDNLRVPDGASCRLKGTRFNGNLVIGRGATLTAEDIMVNGSVQAEGHQSVALGGSSRVGGSVQLKQGGAVRLAGSHVASDVQLDANGGPIDVGGVTVGSNMQIVGNSGGVRLIRNRIAQVLACKENSPPPTGGGNAAGDRKDQCSAP